MTNNIIITDEYYNLRLDQVLAKIWPHFSRTQIQVFIKQQNILVDAKSVPPKHKLKIGEIISYDLPPPKSLTNEAQALPLDIVYEDEALLIINKPVGLVVHPGAGQPDATLLNALLHYADELKHVARAGIMHRLDKDTSGLLLIAKSNSVALTLNKQMKKRAITREYQAIVNGRFISGGTVNAPIARHHLQRKRMAIVETGKSAITHYRILEKFTAHTLLKIRLETGRTHQIRVHMAYLRHPIVGDKTYGKVQISKGMMPDLIPLLQQFPRQALHAFALTFTHPLTEKEMHISIDLPTDMSSLINLLREDYELHSSKLARP